MSLVSFIKWTGGLDNPCGPCQLSHNRPRIPPPKSGGYTEAVPLVSPACLYLFSNIQQPGWWGVGLGHVEGGQRGQQSTLRLAVQIPMLLSPTCSFNETLSAHFRSSKLPRSVRWKDVCPGKVQPLSSQSCFCRLSPSVGCKETRNKRDQPGDLQDEEHVIEWLHWEMATWGHCTLRNGIRT